jgi:RsiW-degrading membrane proteinase PrsW (M82 family)
MINNLLFISLAPVLIIAFYIYGRDKYEKEPFSILLKALFTGIVIVLPVLIVEKLLSQVKPLTGSLGSAAYDAFVIAGLTEEGFKFLGFYLIFWNNRNFNERFDGIVYAVFIAMGFAAIENMIYVFTGGYSVGVLRALTAVPAHALFGIMMGYYFGLARFMTSRRIIFLFLAFFMPFLSHATYDFLLMSQSPLFMTLFIPVFIYFFFNGFRKLSKLSDASGFRDRDDGK